MTPSRHVFTARRLTRLLVTWLIALVLPLQVAALGVFAAQGPAHLHSVADAAPLTLEDAGRWKAGPAGVTHVLASLGHSHPDDAGQRHHHEHDDASVVLTHVDEPATDDATGAAGVAVLALIPSFGAPARQVDSTRAIAGPGWSLRTGFSPPLTRPPRRG